MRCGPKTGISLSHATPRVCHCQCSAAQAAASSRTLHACTLPCPALPCAALRCRQRCGRGCGRVQARGQHLGHVPAPRGHQQGVRRRPRHPARPGAGDAGAAQGARGVVLKCAQGQSVNQRPPSLPLHALLEEVCGPAAQHLTMRLPVCCVATPHQTLSRLPSAACPSGQGLRPVLGSDAAPVLLWPAHMCLHACCLRHAPCAGVPLQDGAGRGPRGGGRCHEAVRGGEARVRRAWQGRHRHPLHACWPPDGTGWSDRSAACRWLAQQGD